ncbi:hypothetical protein PENCOP_c010G01228 [Penicillium coprophilum]|uniref:Calcineurin-like phosphoesterase domain-containing protein n=1 Tax=Penicillium coprophilum TaxID=36646 RepID=A0A1V6UFW3_9EURO|nr:hypothetical protein PENCOP_c010G01228 [Penicillium coprophilum]
MKSGFIVRLQMNLGVLLDNRSCPSSWDGSNALLNSSDLFYQIVDRRSPHIIPNTLFGHTHENEFMIYCTNYGTMQDADNARTTDWIMPTIAPRRNLKSGFRVYEVGTGDFNIYEAYTSTAICRITRLSRTQVQHLRFNIPPVMHMDL